MTEERSRLARIAARRALQVRRSTGLKSWEAVCVFDLAERLGIEVRLLDIPSMEAVYITGERPTIILSSLRPPGRQAFSCAHELGHHAFGHGEQFHEVIGVRTGDQRSDLREFQADCFAGLLLMPPSAISRGFAVRGLDPGKCSAAELYTVSCWLGVGYTTLIHHMERALGVLNAERAQRLRAASLRTIQSTFFPGKHDGDLVVVDQWWVDRAIDVSVSNLVVLPSSAEVEGHCIEKVGATDSRVVARAMRPGIGRVVAEALGWAGYVRVSRKGYVGRGVYRFEEEADDG